MRSRSRLRSGSRGRSRWRCPTAGRVRLRSSGRARCGSLGLQLAVGPAQVCQSALHQQRLVCCPPPRAAWLIAPVRVWEIPRALFPSTPQSVFCPVYGPVYVEPPALLVPVTGQPLWVSVFSYCWIFPSWLCLVVSPYLSSVPSTVMHLKDELLLIGLCLHFRRL